MLGLRVRCLYAAFCRSLATCFCVLVGACLLQAWVLIKLHQVLFGCAGLLLAFRSKALWHSGRRKEKCIVRVYMYTRNHFPSNLVGSSPLSAGEVEVGVLLFCLWKGCVYQIQRPLVFIVVQKNSCYCSSIHILISWSKD